MAIRNGITVRGMWFQTSILFYHVFVFHVSSKESIVFISFHSKKWRYDDVTPALWQNQIIVITDSIFLKFYIRCHTFWMGDFIHDKIYVFWKKKQKTDTSSIMSSHSCCRTALTYLPKKLLFTKTLIWPSKLSLI